MPFFFHFLHSHHNLTVLEVSRNESALHHLVDSELNIFGGVDKITVSLDTIIFFSAVNIFLSC